MADTSIQFSATGTEQTADAQQIQELSLLLTANMLIGALVGSASAYMAFANVPGFSLSFTVTLAAIAGAAIGATGGMLIGGLIDIVAGGRLDQ